MNNIEEIIENEETALEEQQEEIIVDMSGCGACAMKISLIEC